MLPSDLRSHRTLNSQSAVGNNFFSQIKCADQASLHD